MIVAFNVHLDKNDSDTSSNQKLHHLHGVRSQQPTRAVSDRICHSIQRERLLFFSSLIQVGIFSWPLCISLSMELCKNGVIV